LIIAVMCGFSAVASAGQPPSFSLISPVFLSSYRPLNSSVSLKVKQWEYRSRAIEPKIVSFRERECDDPPSQLFAWEEGGVTVVLWDSRANYICRYVVYRSDGDGTLAPLNAIPISGTRFMDKSGRGMGGSDYYVEPIDAGGLRGRLSAKAAWLEPEVVPPISY